TQVGANVSAILRSSSDTGLTSVGLGHETAQHNLGPVAARDGAGSSPLRSLQAEEGPATAAGFRVTGHCHHEHENARDKIR
ncbi:hypothetical protein M3C27_007175, partial [Micrococcus luteus]|nr:hypothetical protein [Micrococcus luteus]